MNREFLDAITTLFYDLDEEIYLEDFFYDELDIFNFIFGIKKDEKFEQNLIKNVKKHCKCLRKATFVSEDFYNSVNKLNSISKNTKKPFYIISNGICKYSLIQYIFNGQLDKKFEQKLIKIAK